MRGNVDSLTLCLFDSFFRPQAEAPSEARVAGKIVDTM